MADMTREQLESLMLDVYAARMDARDYLDYFIDPDEKREIEKYKAVVAKEFVPGKGRPKCRTTPCKTGIKRLAVLGVGETGLIEARLWTVRCICVYAYLQRGWSKPSHRALAVNMLEKALEMMIGSGAAKEFEPKVAEIKEIVRLSRGELRNELIAILGE